MLKRDCRMGVALRTAEQSHVVSSKHGCAIYGLRGKLLAVGHNKHIPINENRTIFTLHAEEVAMNLVRKRDIPMIREVYVARAGQNCYSRPCSRCQALFQKNIGTNVRVYYTTCTGI